MTCFNVIIADPPWAFSDKLTMSTTPRGAETNYKTLTTNELCQLKVDSIADKENGCVLALWVPGALIEDGIKVMNAWGFQCKSNVQWGKTKQKPLDSLKKLLKNKPWTEQEKIIDDFDLNECFSFGLGRLFRQCHELTLIGTNNNNVYKHLENKSQRSMFLSPATEHSIKPDILHKRLELMFPQGNKLEMFARRFYPNWYCCGNELQNEDIAQSIESLRLSSYLEKFIK